MNITREHLDELNAVITISITKDDYTPKVDAVLNDYRKKASVPGFRKGHVPIGLVKKQYGKAVLVDEVNRLLQDSLYKYLTEEKLDVLGTPIPKPQNQLDWEAQNFSFEFELGLSPDFKVDLQFEKPLTHYQITVDDVMIETEIERLQKEYGELVSQPQVERESEIRGVFSNEERNIHRKATLTLDKIKNDENREKCIGAQVGDTLVFSTEELFKDEHDLIQFLGVSHEEAHNLKIEVLFTIEEIHLRKSAELNQEFFDRLFGKDVVTSEDDFRAKIKENYEKQYHSHTDRKLLDDVNEYLVEHTHFNLPANFLKKWIQTTGEQNVSEEQAAEEYKKSERSLRYQLIENKLIKEYQLEITTEELKTAAINFVITQMIRFGNYNISQGEVETAASKILANQDYAKRLSEQIMSEKIINLYKEKATLAIKKLSYEEFTKAVYA